MASQQAEVREGLSFINIALLTFAGIAVFDAIGLGFPDGGLILQTRTLVVAMVLGIVVTTLASIGPSRRASRVSPMEALRADAGGEAETLGRWRTLVGGVATVAGVAGLALGLADVVAQPAIAAGAGTALAFIGVALLAPYLAGPAATVIGALPSRRGVPGRLARNNAADNPKLTASTASALMIGVALVSFVSIFAASS